MREEGIIQTEIYFRKFEPPTFEIYILNQCKFTRCERVVITSKPLALASI